MPAALRAPAQVSARGAAARRGHLGPRAPRSRSPRAAAARVCALRPGRGSRPLHAPGWGPPPLRTPLFIVAPLRAEEDRPAAQGPLTRQGEPAAEDGRLPALGWRCGGARGSGPRPGRGGRPAHCLLPFLHSAGPRLVFQRVAGRRAPGEGGQEPYTPAHQENVRFVSEGTGRASGRGPALRGARRPGPTVPPLPAAWQQVQRQLAGERGPRPVQYVERSPNPRLQGERPARGSGGRPGPAQPRTAPLSALSPARPRSARRLRAHRPGRVVGSAVPGPGHQLLLAAAGQAARASHTASARAGVAAPPPPAPLCSAQ